MRILFTQLSFEVDTGTTEATWISSGYNIRMRTSAGLVMKWSKRPRLLKPTMRQQTMRGRTGGGGQILRVEGNKKALIKNHRRIATCQADFTVGCLAVYDLCGCHIARCEVGCGIKPDPCPHPNKKGPSYQVVLQIVTVVTIVVWRFWRGSSWGRWWLRST